MDFDGDTARVLFENGAIVIMHDVPTGTEIGMDYQSWYSGEKFQGIKMIPPGFHFIFYSTKNSNNEQSARKGVFLFLKEKDVAVFRWKQNTEELCQEMLTDDEIDYYRKEKRSLDGNLGPYPYDKFTAWKAVSKFISRQTVERVQPLCHTLSPMTEVDYKSLPSKPTSTEDEVINRNLNPNHVLNFTAIPSMRYPNDSTSSEVTAHCLDRSFALEEMLKCFKADTSETELLGEMQFAFVCFVLGQVYDAFEYWKAIVILLTSCETAIRQRPSLFTKFMDIMYFELQEIPEDFFVDIVSQTNFLVRSFQTFFSFFDDEHSQNMDSRLSQKCSKLKSFLSSKFKWSFDEEFDDDAPVVVDLDERLF